MFWNPRDAAIYDRLRDGEVNLFYVAAYLDALRAQHPVGTDWMTIFEQRTPIGEYNVNDVFATQLVWSAFHYSYLNT